MENEDQNAALELQARLNGCLPPPEQQVQSAISSDALPRCRRRTNRVALSLATTVREPGKSRLTANMVDMSVLGCRIELPYLPLCEPWVWLNVVGLETQYCRVIWQENGFAGLEFSSPLNEAVLNNLLAGQKAVSERIILRLREIATRTASIIARAEDQAEVPSLKELSRECAERAVVFGLQLGGVDTDQNMPGRLNSTMIRRGSERAPLVT